MTFKVGFSKIGPSTFDTLDLTEFLSQSFSGPWLAKWHYNSVGRLQLSKVLFSYLLHSIASLRRSMNVTLLQRVAQFILPIKKGFSREDLFLRTTQWKACYYHHWWKRRTSEANIRKHTTRSRSIGQRWELEQINKISPITSHQSFHFNIHSFTLLSIDTTYSKLHSLHKTNLNELHRESKSPHLPFIMKKYELLSEFSYHGQEAFLPLL